MPRTKRRDAPEDMKRLAKFFREEIARRAWGQAEFKKLIAASAAAGEKTDENEREAVRLTLAAVDRVMSIKAATGCVLVILEESPGRGGVPADVALDVVAAMKEQAGHAVADAFAALRGAVPVRPERRRLPFGKEEIGRASCRERV